MSSPAGHETPEQRTAMEQAFTQLAHSQNSAGPLGEHIARLIRDRQARRRGAQTPTDSKD